MRNNSNQQRSFAFIDLFAGIGGFRIVLEKAGGTCVFSSEWNQNSKDVYLKNFGEFPHDDITKIAEIDIPEHDVLCAGFPCQAFSVSGKRLGFKDTRGTLFFDVVRIAKYHQPSVLFLENVKNLANHDNGKTLKTILKVLDEIGYTPFIDILRSSDFGVPQARERIYIVAFRKDLCIESLVFPNPLRKTKVVKDILESEIAIPLSCYINRKDIAFSRDETEVSDKRKPLQIGRINHGGQGERIYSIYAAGITLSAYGGGAASKTGAYLVGKRIRKLTPRECARMQGFPESFKLPNSKNIAYKQFGDSVSIPVLKMIFANILMVYPQLANKRRFLSIKKEILENPRPALFKA